MKTILSKSVLGALALLSSIATSAQEPDPQIPEEKLQEIKAQKVAYLTQKMDLTPEESQKFWPVYNQYDKELEALRKERREAHKAMKDKTDLSEADAAKAIDDELASQQKELDLRKKYTAEFKKTIGAKKTMMLFRAERDFNRELLGRMRDRMKGDKDGPPHGGPPKR
jgi:Skp family chaperone for outer membrane proteins